MVNELALRRALTGYYFKRRNNGLFSLIGGLTEADEFA